LNWYTEVTHRTRGPRRVQGTTERKPKRSKGKCGRGTCIGKSLVGGVLEGEWSGNCGPEVAGRNKKGGGDFLSPTLEDQKMSWKR